MQVQCKWEGLGHDTILFYAKSDEAFFDLPLAEHKSGLHNKGTVFGKRDGDEAAVRKREAEGKSLEDWWTDIGAGGHMPRKERLGYPTQKPEALLRRILQASSREGDMVLDPYCGCGTTIHVAEQLGRNYMGVDITHYAIEIIEFRFRSKLLMPPPPVEGRPADLGGALDLGGLKAVLQRARVLLCNDAGARHIAVAFGVPCVVPMGPTALAKTNWNLEQVTVLSAGVECSPCYHRVCPIDHRCMTQIPAAQAAEAALAAFESGAARAAGGAA